MLSNSEHKYIKNVVNGSSANSFSINNKISLGGIGDSDFMSENSQRIFLQNNHNNIISNDIYNYPLIPTLKIDKILNEAEILDYVGFKGQWDYKALLAAEGQTKPLLPLSVSDLNNLNYPVMPHANDSIIDSNTNSNNSNNPKEKAKTTTVKNAKGVVTLPAQAKESNPLSSSEAKNYMNFDIKDDINNPISLAIPSDKVANYQFGDLIELLTKIKYENNLLFINEEIARNKKKISENNNEENLDNYHTNNINNHNFTKKKGMSVELNKNLFDHIPVKIALIGEDFAGKKTQAKLLSQNFPLKIYQLSGSFHWYNNYKI